MAKVAASYPPGGGSTPPRTSAGQEQSTGSSAMQAGTEVLESAREQGREVTAEAGRQVRSLARQAQSQVADQARGQQQRAASGLKSLGEELRAMADNAPEPGTATQLVQQVSEQVERAGHWLESREPGAIFGEIRSYARRNPGMFLLGAGVLGVLAGRITRNMGGAPTPTSPDYPRGETFTSTLPPAAEPVSGTGPVPATSAVADLPPTTTGRPGQSDPRQAMV
ncbi:MAG TPA: hypothetical protein VFY17_05230 [Pilimelia sp.]|nr:hypothetical protein [Pilimelia sp.]